MRIEVRENRRRVGRVMVDSAARPTKILAESQRDVFMNWDGALDDAGRLRRCVLCGCSELFQEKAFPQVTGIVIVLAFAGAAAGAFGLVTNIPVLVLMTILLVIDIGILVFSKKRLVCYRCRSSYHDLKIARYHRPWDRSIADRYGRATTRSSGDSQQFMATTRAAGAARAGGISS